MSENFFYFGSVVASDRREDYETMMAEAKIDINIFW